MKVERTYAVEAEGIGRRDYSTGTEFSVEPVIRSYQSVYSSWDYVTVPAGSDLTVDIAIPTGYVAIVYDFYATGPYSTLLEMNVQAISGGVSGDVVTKSGYGAIVSHLPKGFPFDEIIRFVLHNYAVFDVDIDIGAVGIYTDQEHYLLTTE